LIMNEKKTHSEPDFSLKFT